jgi:hypothetical protein
MNVGSQNWFIEGGQNWVIVPTVETLRVYERSVHRGGLAGISTS